MVIPNTVIHRGTGIAAAFVIGSINAPGGGRGTITPTPDAWVARTGNVGYTTTDATNWAAANGNYIQVTGVKISKSPSPTFSLAGRDNLAEYYLCLRYYELVPGTSVPARPLYTHYPYKVAKRAAPTLTLVAGGLAGANFAVGPDPLNSMRCPDSGVATSAADWFISADIEF